MPERAKQPGVVHPPTESTATYEPSEHEDEIRGLLGDYASEVAVAWIVAQHPIYEAEFAQYLQEVHGNGYARTVMTLVAGLQKAAADHPTAVMSDHSAGAQGRGWLSNDQVVTATDTTAPKPTEALPYDGRGGWDAVVINTRLGQVDQIATTNSDGDRCAFATALAAQIFVGPAAVASWTQAYAEQHEQAYPSQREAAARRVIDAVGAAVTSGHATYGDLSWMQEALHDLVLNKDHAGTKTSFEVVSPTVEDFTELPEQDCTTAKQVRDAAKQLQPGERMMVEWHATRVLGGEIAHQLMLYNDAGAFYIYDPQPFANGVHLVEVDAAGLGHYFSKDYEKSVLKMAGKVTPKAPAAQP